MGAALLVLAAPESGVAQSRVAPAPGTTQSAPIVPTAPPASLLPGPDSTTTVEPLQSDPRRDATAAAQAKRLMGERRFDDALKVLEPALKGSPRDPQLRFLYGVTLAERGQAQDATEVFEQLTQDFPELPEPYNNLAVMYAAAGNLERARSALENAVRALPGYSLAHENLGDVYLRMAARAYERAAGLDSGAAKARNKLALARELLARIAPTPNAGAAPARSN